MKILLIGLLVLSSLSAIADDHDGVDFFFNQARGCHDARVAYETMEIRDIRDLGYGEGFDITGSLPDHTQVSIILRRYRARGPGGFGPSGWIDTYSCSVEKH